MIVAWFPKFLAPERLWWLLGAAVLVGAYIAVQFRRKVYAVRFTNVALLDAIAPKRPGWRRHVVAAGFLVALMVGIGAMAQPLGTVRVPKDRATILLAIDTSLSMEADDVDPTRIEAAKVAAKGFVESLPPKINVGLISFSKTTALSTPPTQDRRVLDAGIDQLELGQGTATGDAIDLALATIANLKPDETGEPAPAAVVLMSDGKQTYGVDVNDAASRAKDAGIQVWTIAFGTPSASIQVTDPDTGEILRIPVPIDEQSMRDVAAATGGESFTAESASDLVKVYDTLRTSVGYDTEDREVTWQWIAVAMALLGLTAVGSLVWTQRLP